MVVDRSAFNGSRNMFDQHRDMRLDIENMSYEELLALGERIGNVSTGGLSFCCTELVASRIIATTSVVLVPKESCDFGRHWNYIFSNFKNACCNWQEEYEDMDDVGSLKICGHDYHVNCIKKWLSMKNLCPICKAPAVADNMKE
ncbi:hypothetical protein GH714_028012 [Hevea brasiliensis]|uniref:RING-type E3 ubiquitin transferase n=1 Tax=Hevea brasiliensis TaxID=3981 RepID=A0A6A6MGN7_HEVBR|nr:hypothetical protein GH714_028012 [Hevea brasiliensis]